MPPNEEEMAPAIAAIQRSVPVPLTVVEVAPPPPTNPPSPPDPDEHGLLISATSYGTVFVRGVETSLDLGIEQLDRVAQRLLDARAPDGGGKGESTFDEGIHIFAQDGSVEFGKHVLPRSTQVDSVVADLRRARVKAVAIRVSAARSRVVQAQTELDAALKL
jgi:hypothetical protein